MVDLAIKFHLLRGLRIFIFLLIFGIMVAIPTGIITYPVVLLVTYGLIQQGNVTALSGVMILFYVLSIPVYIYFLSVMLK